MSSKGGVRSHLEFEYLLKSHGSIWEIAFSNCGVDDSSRCTLASCIIGKREK